MTSRMGPPPGSDFRYEKVQKPKKLREIPQYLRILLGGFFHRLFYIFGLVWKADPVSLIVLLLIAIFNGFMPVISSLISKEILNELQGIIEQTALGRAVGSFWGSTILFLLIFFFTLKILQRVSTDSATPLHE